MLISAAVIALGGVGQLPGHLRGSGYKVVLRLSLLSLVVFAGILVIGAIQLFDLSLITDSIDLGTLPALDDLVFAMVIATVACTGIEAASGPGRRRAGAPVGAAAGDAGGRGVACWCCTWRCR